GRAPAHLGRVGGGDGSGAAPCGAGAVRDPGPAQRVRASAVAGAAAARPAAARRRHARQLLEPRLPARAGLLRAHLRRRLGAGGLGDAGVERVGRVLPRPPRVLPVRALEHPRVPAPRAAGARGGLGHDAAARPGRSGGGHRGRHEPGAPARRPPARRGMGARRVPVAPGGAAPLPRAERQPAAAARALGAPGPGRGSAGRGVPRPARARAPGAEGAGVGAHRAGAAPGHRARGAGRRAPGPGRARSRRERRRDPRQAPLDRGPGGGAVKAAAAGWRVAAPALAVVGLFFALPVGASLLLSLTDFDLYALADPRHLRLVGLGNYADLLRAPLFWKAMWNTTYFVLVGV